MPWLELLFLQQRWVTLLSTVIGPLIILRLLLKFGPCILNRLVAFIMGCLNTVQIMVLKQQYEAMEQDDL